MRLFAKKLIFFFLCFFLSARLKSVMLTWHLLYVNWSRCYYLIPQLTQSPLVLPVQCGVRLPLPHPEHRVVSGLGTIAATHTGDPCSYWGDRRHWWVSTCLVKAHHAQIFTMTSSNWNVFRVTGPLCGEFTGHWWIPHTKAGDAELWCFLWSAPK